jgi:[acyl-carrier-protein] S-malonyltransferase
LKEILFQLPGQGSHSLQMGKDLWESGDSFFKELLEIGSETSKVNLPKIIFGEDENIFIQSKVLQPAISAITLTLVKILAENGIVPTTVMGHSLGEITALGVVGSLTPQKAVEFAAFRGCLMDESSKKCGGGAMTAVLMTNAEDCQKTIYELGLETEIFVANDNAPTQAVVSGKIITIETFEESMRTQHSVKCKRIAVAGPWHTPFIQHAKDVFGEWVKNEKIASPKCKFIMNGTAREEISPEKISELITNQFVKPVRWRESCEFIKDTHFSAILDVGPGKILSGLMRANKITKITDYCGVVSSIDEAKKVAEEL